MTQEMLKIVRVSYGKDSTPLGKREYMMVGGSPVGFVSDWLTIAKNNNLDGLIIHEKDGTTREVIDEEKLGVEDDE